jgi:indolepyruvate ferredoxin oxidoreductase, beta subunit
VSYDVLVAGVGGQGVISAALLLAEAARRDGFDVHQGEVHGMSQRGGAVQATVRMGRDGVGGSLIPAGEIDLVLGLEPVEALRFVPGLSPTGHVVAAAEPVENIPDYPPLESILEALRAVPGGLVVQAEALAREAGSFRAANVVLLGAASPLLPVRRETLEACIEDLFSARSPRLAAVNHRAFDLGRGAAAPAGR